MEAAPWAPPCAQAMRTEPAPRSLVRRKEDHERHRFGNEQGCVEQVSLGPELERVAQLVGEDEPASRARELKARDDNDELSMRIEIEGGEAEQRADCQCVQAEHPYGVSERGRFTD